MFLFDDYILGLKFDQNQLSYLKAFSVRNAIYSFLWKSQFRYAV